MTVINILPRKHSTSRASEQMRNYRKSHPDYVQREKARRKLRRLLIMDALGGRKCKRCGYADVRALVLDHKNGGGHQQRLQSTFKMYHYYYANLDVAKHDLQVLCANCNMIKQVENREYAYDSTPRGTSREAKHIENTIYHNRETKKGKRSA